MRLRSVGAAARAGGHDFRGSRCGSVLEALAATIGGGNGKNEPKKRAS